MARQLVRASVAIAASQRPLALGEQREDADLVFVDLDQRGKQTIKLVNTSDLRDLPPPSPDLVTLRS